MTDNVINLDDHRPHMSTYVACLECAKDWIAVAPADGDEKSSKDYDQAALPHLWVRCQGDYGGEGESRWLIHTEE